MENLDIVERLRGKVRVPVNDGAGPLNGLDYFERTFPTSKAAMEAADEIERLREALTVIAEWDQVNYSNEYESGLRGIIRSITDRARDTLSSSR